MTEYFEIVDEEDRVIGKAPRSRCHGDPSLIHRVAHVLVVDKQNRLLLQKRAADKDIQPGKWDTSVGGHLNIGEDYESAAYREMKEELGIEGVELTFLYAYPLRNEIESENVRTYLCRHDGQINFDPVEITEVRHWTLDVIEGNLGTEIFTPNFEQEFGYYKQAISHQRSAVSKKQKTKTDWK
jgi:isopentenyl-diphosphate delta-isomerase type 1